MPEAWIVILAVVVVGIALPLVAVRATRRRKRYFYGGAADPLSSNQPAQRDRAGNLHTVVEVEGADPVTPDAPGETSREPQAQDTGPARENSPGWTDVTDPPPTASEAGDDTNHDPPGPRRSGE